MPEATDTGFLSIGEVLGLLLEEFPDITISKIRFLESQGLISPERTASGYRKFYNDDVELLKVILTEQRRNYLPLRVIKDRLDSGQIDPTGEHDRPNEGRRPTRRLIGEGSTVPPAEDDGDRRPPGGAQIEHQGPSRVATQVRTAEPEPEVRAPRAPAAERPPPRRRTSSRSCSRACCSNATSCARWSA